MFNDNVLTYIDWNKKLSYCWDDGMTLTNKQDVRRDSMRRIAKMDVEMRT